MAERELEIIIRVPPGIVSELVRDYEGKYIINDEVHSVVNSLKTSGVLPAGVSAKVKIEQDVNCSKAKVEVAGLEYEIVPHKKLKLN